MPRSVLRYVEAVQAVLERERRARALLAGDDSLAVGGPLGAAIDTAEERNGRASSDRYGSQGADLARTQSSAKVGKVRSVGGERSSSRHPRIEHGNDSCAQVQGIHLA